MTSPASRASRKPAQSKLNFFPTPPWAVRALLHEVLAPAGLIGPDQSCWEPACGAGHCALPLAQDFGRLFASDVHDWGFGDVRNLDFSMASAADAPWPVDWIITNPPFVLAETFARRGLEIARRGVALLVRLQWLEGEERHRLFFADDAPYRASRVVVFAERVPMIEGAWDPEASSATAYCWVIWEHDAPRTGPLQLIHLPPGMKRRYTLGMDGQLGPLPGEARRRREAAAAS